MSFRNCKLRNTCLCKCLKSHLSVNPRTVNMLKHPKHYCNMRDSSLINFVEYPGEISVAKTLS